MERARRKYDRRRRIDKHIQDFLTYLFPELDMAVFYFYKIKVTGPALFAVISEFPKPKYWHRKTKAELFQFLCYCSKLKINVSRNLIETIAFELQMGSLIDPRMYCDYPALTIHAESKYILGKFRDKTAPWVEDPAFYEEQCIYTHPCGLQIQLVNDFYDRVTDKYEFETPYFSRSLLIPLKFKIGSMKLSMDLAPTDGFFGGDFAKSYYHNDDLRIQKLFVSQREALLQLHVVDKKLEFQILDQLRIRVDNLDQILQAFDRYQSIITADIRERQAKIDQAYAE